MLPCDNIIVLLLFVLTVSESEQCERHEAIHGCTVDSGHAHCESWDLAASIQGLPSCTTRITFSLLADPQYIDVKRFRRKYLLNANFSHLNGLEELSISSNHKNYSHVQIFVDSQVAVKVMPNIKVLRLKVMQSLEVMHAANEGVYKRMKYLELLDFTRAQRIGLSYANHIIGMEPSMKTLILKNIQEIGHADTYNPYINLTRFVCGGNVMSLDLSYNDIAFINISNGCSNTKLRYINLNHNILASMGNNLLLGAYSMLAGVETLILSSVCPSQKYQKDLWDNASIPKYHDSGDVKLSPLSNLFLDSPFSSLARYDFWLRDVIQHCGNFRTIDITQCILQRPKDICDLAERCFAPNKNLPPCPRDKSIKQLEYFLENMCNYTQCRYNIPIPIPPQLRIISVQNLGTLSRLVTKIPSGNNKTLCIHPNNNLEVLDLPNINFGQEEVFSGLYHLSGLQKLKYLNIQGHRLPVLLSQVVLHDAVSMVELHIGGNKIFENDVLPADHLQNFIQLSILNLSSANLLGIESDAFIYHRHLAVLDLSYNHLSLSSLSSLDLSKTSMKSLNLSNNQLTTIPTPLRHQLDEMEGLDLYLSGNSFICNCENLEFLQWIQQSSISRITFHYAGDHVCADSPGNTIHNIAIDSLYCDWYWKQPVIAVVSSLALSLFSAMVLGMYKKRWFISNLIFRFQERFRTASDDNSAGPFKFDAFVVYSDIPDDRLWVHYKLVDKLEKEFGFRLCLEHRDFLGGVVKLDCIEKAIRSSRKVLVILSENLLQDGWCKDTVQMTFNVDRKKFVVIMYKDVLLTGVPSVFQFMLESTGSITWVEDPAPAQKLFWKKLTTALYSKQKDTVIDTRTGECYNMEQSLLNE